jgi:formylmethanofuran dehydrogenase subunit A
MWHRDIYWFDCKIEISIINTLNKTVRSTFYEFYTIGLKVTLVGWNTLPE